jgi:two-component system chemotaxis response regulator CheY
MKKILIADDSVFMRLWLKKILSENKQFIFIEAENGFSAIDLYKLHTPDLVLMDFTMPKLNGIEALKGIIKFDSKATLVMCSSLGQRELIIDAINFGAKDYVVKPHFSNLLSIVNNHL